MNDPTKTTPKKKPWPKWAKRFLKAFRETGIVREAAKKTGIHHSTAYDLKATDADFARAWEEVEEWSTEQLEQVAYKRAVDGSDLLMIFLLKARKPHVYRDSVKVEHGGRVTHQIEQSIDDEISAFLAARDAEKRSEEEAAKPAG